MKSMTRDDIKFVACPSLGCDGDLHWVDEYTVKCTKCAYQDEMKKNE